MKTENQYPKVVQDIHREFLTAGDELLKVVEGMLNEHTEAHNQKIQRLQNVGFTEVPEVKKWNKVSVSYEFANLIQSYKIRYANKFITDEQVKAICKKYNLICAPVSRFKGFVPDVNLRQIESFKLQEKDKNSLMVKITRAWHTGAAHDFIIRSLGARWIHRQLKQPLIPVDSPNLSWHGDKLFSVSVGDRESCYVDSWKIFDNTKLLICAPKKDMDVRGLQQINGVFQELGFFKAEYPDPVVLQPCKGGYLIVTAWGDEASDPLVVNEKMN